MLNQPLFHQRQILRFPAFTFYASTTYQTRFAENYRLRAHNKDERQIQPVRAAQGKDPQQTIARNCVCASRKWFIPLWIGIRNCTRNRP
jgi:hypothetical protein